MTTYSPDGSGRDMWIDVNNGGYHPSKKVAAYKMTFPDQLRAQTYAEQETLDTHNYMARRHQRMLPFLT